MRYELANGQIIDDESLSEIMETLMRIQPHKSMTYTWDDIGTATLMSDVYKDSIYRESDEMKGVRMRESSTTIPKIDEGMERNS